MKHLILAFIGVLAATAPASAAWLSSGPDCGSSDTIQVLQDILSKEYGQDDYVVSTIRTSARDAGTGTVNCVAHFEFPIMERAAAANIEEMDREKSAGGKGAEWTHALSQDLQMASAKLWFRTMSGKVGDKIGDELAYKVESTSDGGIYVTIADLPRDAITVDAAQKLLDAMEPDARRKREETYRAEQEAKQEAIRKRDEHIAQGLAAKLKRAKEIEAEKKSFKKYDPYGPPPDVTKAHMR